MIAHYLHDSRVALNTDVHTSKGTDPADFLSQLSMQLERHLAQPPHGIRTKLWLHHVPMPSYDTGQAPGAQPRRRGKKIIISKKMHLPANIFKLAFDERLKQRLPRWACH